MIYHPDAADGSWLETCTLPGSDKAECTASLNTFIACRSSQSWSPTSRSGASRRARRAGNEIAGIGIFDTHPDQARSIMADDPGVRAGIFTFEVHTCRGSGDALPS